MDVAKFKPGEKMVVDTGKLVDTIITLASFKRESAKEENVLQDPHRYPPNKPCFTIILILFKSFHAKLEKYV